MRARFEHKYLFHNQNEDQIVDHFASRDCFLEKQACYRVCSVYYDTPDFLCARKNLLGLTPREKYRFRLYGDPGSGVSLSGTSGFFEEKKKIASHVHKTRSPITFEQAVDARELLQGPIIRDSVLHGDVTEAYGNVCHFNPSLLVSYVRSRYRVIDANSELTIDTGLTFMHTMDMHRVIDRSDTVVVEHKYSLEHALRLDVPFRRPRTRFSKYLFGLHQAGLLYEY